MLSFNLAAIDEIREELGRRLRQQRLMQDINQNELAERAGVATGTIRNLEARGQCSLDTLIRIVRALGLTDDLAPLFVLKVQSIAQMERNQHATRSRASRKKT